MLLNNSEYLSIIKDIKSKIQTTRLRAVLSVNKELIVLYWNIGKIINGKAKWGNKFVDNLAKDIKLEFPDITGFSVRNLKYMAKFYVVYPSLQIVQTLSAQLPWSHNIELLDKVKNDAERVWYAGQVLKNGWSLNVLKHQINTKLYKRQAFGKTNNFLKLLPKPQSDLANAVMKDCYVFDFISADSALTETGLERELVKSITRFLLELGTGFSFVGNQYHIEVSKQDFYIDLLFYHLDLCCYVVVELKTGKFKPEYAGQLNFYLSAVDVLLKKQQDNPSIGILLCAEKDNLIAEYSIKDMTKPIGVSAYKVLEKLPKKYEKLLPSVEDIRKRLIK